MYQLRYLCDGTLEGLLTAVFVAFRQHECPTNIVIDEATQASLFDSDVPIITDLALAERVRDGIIGKLGASAYQKVKECFLAEDPSRGGTILRYLRYTMRGGHRSLGHLAAPAVAEAEAIIQRVSTEAHAMIQFARFADVGSGLFYSHIRPRASVVPLIMGHFAARFNVQPFIIHDSRHQLSGVFDTERWWLVEGLPQALSLPTVEEDKFQELWRCFYQTIAIPERRNPVVQRGFMSKRFWGDMCEQRLHYQRRGDEV
ncbi:MAG: TIGR03915 family putative DNA repair protein [Actinomycetia bacterium]|nr:TIGR03915 family putative DNA repair protein [Actinomycetes bacterium]